jgi:hypothetical protein
MIIDGRATASPAAGGAGETRVGGTVERRGAIAVTGTRRVTVARGGLELLRVVDEERIALRAAAPDGVRFSRDDVPDWPRVERRLVDAGAELGEEGEVTIVGPGVGSDAGMIRRALAVAGEVRGFQAAPLRLSVAVAPERVDDVTRALHAALVT